MRAGFAKVCITPPAGSPLSGFRARLGPSTGVHDDLYVRTLVLISGSQRVALLSAEVLALAGDTVRLIRERIGRRYGLLPADILVAATHTHSGPITLRTFFNEDEVPDPGYLEHVIEACAKAVEQALQDSFEGEVGIGHCEVEGVGVNRRDPSSDAVDRQAAVLRIDEAGKTRAAVVIYGCHPTVLGFANHLVSGDYPAAAIAQMEAALGPDSFAMFFNSAAANISSGHSAELNLAGISNGDRSFEHAEVLGGRLAMAVLSALPGIATVTSPMLETGLLTITLNGRSYPDLQTLETAREAARNTASSFPPADPQARAAQMREVYAAIDLNNARRLLSQGGRIPVEIHAIRLHETVLLGIAGEVFAETSLALKAKLGNRVFLICPANGYAGYLPPEEAFAQGGYEATVAGCAPDSEAKILAAAVALDKLVRA